MADWSRQIKDLLSSPLGVEVVRTLKEDLHRRIVEDAEKAMTQETAYGLLKEARGVIRGIEHLQSIAGLSPTDEGGKVKTN